MDVFINETGDTSLVDAQRPSYAQSKDLPGGMPINDHPGIWSDTMAVPYSGAADYMSYALASDPGTGSSIKTPLRRIQRLIAQLSARYEPGAITCSQSLPTHTCSDPDRPFRQSPLLSQASRPHPHDLNKDGNREVGGGLFNNDTRSFGVENWDKNGVSMVEKRDKNGVNTAENWDKNGESIAENWNENGENTVENGVNTVENWNKNGTNTVERRTVVEKGNRLEINQNWENDEEVEENSQTNIEQMKSATLKHDKISNETNRSEIMYRNVKSPGLLFRNFDTTEVSKQQGNFNKNGSEREYKHDMLSDTHSDVCVLEAAEGMDRRNLGHDQRSKSPLTLRTEPLYSSAGPSGNGREEQSPLVTRSTNTDRRETYPPHCNPPQSTFAPSTYRATPFAAVGNAQSSSLLPPYSASGYTPQLQPLPIQNQALRTMSDRNRAVPFMNEQTELSHAARPALHTETLNIDVKSMLRELIREEFASRSSAPGSAVNRETSSDGLWEKFTTSSDTLLNANHTHPAAMVKSADNASAQNDLQSLLRQLVQEQLASGNVKGNTQQSKLTISETVNGEQFAKKTAGFTEGQTDVGKITPAPGKVKQWIKLGQFNGSTPVEAFLRKYEIVAKHNGWQEDERLHQLLCSLTEPASQIIWEYDTNINMSSDELVQKLRSRYGSINQPTQYQTQLGTRKQREGEELGSLVQDIRRLLTLAYPGPLSIHSETIATKAFIDSLRDKSLALKIREREPDSLESAYKLAMRLEGYKRAEEDQRETPEKRPYRNCRVEEADLMNSILNRLESVEQTLHEVHSSRQTENNWSTTRNQSEPATRSAWAETQRQSGDGRRFHNQRSSRSNSGRCFSCNGLGHYYRGCPYRQAPASRIPDTDAAEKVEQSNGPSQIRYVQGCSNAYLPLRVNGKRTVALLDTGSETNLIPRSLVHDREIRGSQQLLRAANGTQIRVFGEVSVQCQAADLQFTVKALVTDQLSDMILGLEWLQEQSAEWNFGERYLRIKGRKLTLTGRRRQGLCRRIVTDGRVRVPAHSEMDVMAYAVLPNLYEETKLWATKPQRLDSGLMVSSTLLPPRTVNLTVRVLNPINREIYLSEGQSCMVEEVKLETNNSAHAPPTEIEKEVETVLAPLWSNVAENTPTTIRQKLRTLLIKHHRAFSLNEKDMGFTDIIQHEIDTGNEAPVRQPLRRQPLNLLPMIDEQVEQMLAQNIVEPSISDWASNVVMVRKKDGTPRFCTDYRAVNLKTRKDAYPLPLIGESLDTLAGARWFSTFDLRAGYHQLAVHPKNRHKTAFVTRQGSFQFRVVPFGLCNSPASFSRMMNIVMAGLNYSLCLIYLDDIIA